ncbi:MAG: aspartate-semialdehyde dehydrogenase [Chloroflexi bacterium]|nr:aspartate-semialdehyde dehydrogenase [Chloroflexota bacterium]
MNNPNIVVIGATGTVGTIFLDLLEKRNFPIGNIKVCASPKSVGKKIRFNGLDLLVEEVTDDIFDDADFAFVSASTEVSRNIVPIAANRGSIVIDDSSAFRMQKNVPLVIPEVNANDLKIHENIVAIPNCSTTQMVMALYPLHVKNPIKRVVADTYQSVSGTGGNAMKELEQQTDQINNGLTTSPDVYPHEIGYNVIPHIEGFLEDGYTKEERKMVEETQKIMHANNLAVSATCVRVPVFVSHSESLHIEFSQSMEVDTVKELLSNFPGVSVIDNPEQNLYPLARNSAGSDEVYVGRIRKDISTPNGIAMWVVSDNLRKGAATNAIQIAEEILAQNLLHT